MQYRQLGESQLHVSEIGLGTMTYGQQNSLEEAHQQLDYAFDQGVNLIDTAEMYPVPAKATTQGLAESYIGRWLTRQQRDRIIIATKLAGPSRRLNWIRDGSCRVDRPNIEQAVHDSLKRLNTDYIDLYQIHWPDRYVPLFGQTNYRPEHIRETVPIAEQLSVFADLIQAGKIRYLGLSNETPWGVLTFCQAAQQLGFPRIISVQNAYNLLNRVFDSTLAETCLQEQVGLLAYSPLGFGSLTGKYLLENPTKSRLSLFPGFGQRYLKVNVEAAVSSYTAIAHEQNLDPTTLALAFVRQQWFVTSVLIGATTLDQLQENLDSTKITLSAETLAKIEQVHQLYPNPAP